MIYIENKDGVQRVVIPTNDTNVEYVNFVPQEGDSDYYTKTQTDEKIAQSRTAVLGEVGDWLSHYPTTDQMHDAIENVTVDLTGYATEEYVDAEIQKIPKPDMSDYYTKEETDDKIDDALSAAPSMLENAGFATQNWVNEQDYATTQYVDDAVANIPAGGGIEPFIVEVDSFEPITKTVFEQLFESYSKGIPSYIQSNVQSGITTTPRLIPVVGIYGKPNNVGIAKMWVIYQQSLIEYTRNIFGTSITHTTIPLGGSGDSTDLSDYYTKGEIDTVKDDLQTQITDNKNAISGLDTRVKDIELNGGGSGGGSEVKVYEALWDDVTQGYHRFTNQMVYDMFKDYSDSLTVQVRIGSDLFNVYFAEDADPYYHVDILAGNVLGILEGNINLPSEDAIYEEKILVTDEIWNQVPYLTVTGGAVFNSEVRFNSTGYKDIASGIKCAFKTVKSQSVDQWTRKIHAGTDGDNIYFVSSDEAGNTQLAMIDTVGNIYEGTEKLSDKYATKTYVDEVFDKAIPHKYDYTITDDMTLTGYFSQGEGYELFNDVRDGADVNFKLIMNGGQRKYIPIFIEYDSNVDKANFMFLDYGRYITCTLESNGDMSISTENIN